MGRTTKSLSGGGKDKLLRALVRRESEIAAMPAERLLQRFSEALTEVRVKREVWETVTKSDVAPEAGVKAARPRGAPNAAATPKTMPLQKTENSSPVPPAASTTFDPFAFSALATLTRKGKAGLVAALTDVTTAEQLHALAAAQHLSIDRNLSDTPQVRDAIVAATEARLKERRAAAS
ncbi:MAG: hypothetical protein ABL898_12330 [Hyphomicrobiaceae bacterium]|nr:hypothetical protein [Hyphomicrobiaceae bacterium]